MKKYKIMYICSFVIILILVCINGIKSGIILGHNYYNPNIKIIDGISIIDVFLIYNSIIIITVFSFLLIITLKKDNKVKFKILIFILIIILALFVPIFSEKVSGGIAGINEVTYVKVINIKKINDIYIRTKKENELYKKYNPNKANNKKEDEIVEEPVEYSLETGSYEFSNNKEEIQMKNTFLTSTEDLKNYLAEYGLENKENTIKITRKSNILDLFTEEFFETHNVAVDVLVSRGSATGQYEINSVTRKQTVGLVKITKKITIVGEGNYWGSFMFIIFDKDITDVEFIYVRNKNNYNSGPIY